MAPSEASATACAQPVDRGAMTEIYVMNGAQEHARSTMPGAWPPRQKPNSVNTLGSLKVAKRFTRSP